MTEIEKQDLTLSELNEKTKELDDALSNASFRAKRTRKNIKACKEACKQTNDIITGELNVSSK